MPRMTRLSSFAVASLLLLGLLPLGCAGSGPEPLPRQPVVVQALPSPTATPPAPTVSATDAPPASTAAEPGPEAFPVQAMVGQIAGQPIYAHQVLDGMELQLGNLGRRLPVSTFREQAIALIYERIRGLVQDALLLDEAERNLPPSQREQLSFFVEFQRQNFLRQFGQGSVALAERNILEQTGLTLEQNLRDFRTRFIIRNYLDRNLKPLVNVTRRDIERYYRDNYDYFNPPARREVQMIYADSDSDARWFEQQLQAGTSFEELALDPRNAFRGRDMMLTIEANDTMFGDAIDPYVQTLRQGQWVGPLDNPERRQQWFVYMALLDEPARRSLFDAQVDIERELRARQERELTIQLGERLRNSASFTDERRITEAVLEIAVARYYSPNAL